ncbi:MAG: hypothetical protein UW72_C0004G0043, partial [Parcubacteria group bacterium GW2011_GWF2_44_7]
GQVFKRGVEKIKNAGRIAAPTKLGTNIEFIFLARD